MNMNKSTYKKLGLLFLLLGLLLPTITLSLGELFTFDNEHRETSFNTVTITFIDVSEDDRSCVFKINGKIVVIERHQNYDGEGFSIWVRDAYPVRDQSGTKDVCLAVISGIVTGKKEIIEVKPKLFTNNTENNDTTSIALDNKGSNKEDKFSDQSQPLAPQETLPQPQQQGKNIFYRIVRWIFSFIW